MTVKRYDCELVYRNHWSQDQDASMEEYPDGEYVKHSDYAKLEQAIKRIEEARLECLRKRSLDADGNLFDAIADAAKMVENV